MTIVISEGQLQIISHHTRTTYPEEGCGFLLGSNAYIRRIEHTIPAQNENRNSATNRYRISPEEFMHADREARRLNLDLIGFYHSHPDASPQPSGFDLMYAWPWYSYLILSVWRGEAIEVSAWLLSEDRSSFLEDILYVH